MHVLDRAPVKYRGRGLDKIRFASARSDNMTSLIDAPSESLVACSLLASVSATVPVLLLTYRSDYLFAGRVYRCLVHEYHKSDVVDLLVLSL